MSGGAHLMAAGCQWIFPVESEKYFRPHTVSEEIPGTA